MRTHEAIADAHADAIAFRSRARRSRTGVLFAAGAGLVALGLAAGLMWRTAVGSAEHGGSREATSIVPRGEPTSAAPASSPRADAATSAGLGGRVAAHVPWIESPARAAPPVAAGRQGSAQSRSRGPEEPPVAAWRPIQPRQPAQAPQQAGDARRVGEAVPDAAEPRRDVARLPDEAAYREQPRPSMACTSCGFVQAVRPVPSAAPPSGLGAVAGGVVGGLLGNQVGSGNGRTAMTVLGALGGGLAGHEAERRVGAGTLYEVHIRMDDGTVRTLRQHIAPPAGSRVRFDGNDLRILSGQEPRFVRTGQID